MRNNFGSGFNSNAVRQGGVVVSTKENSARTITPAVKAASKIAIALLKAAVARGDLPQGK